MRGREPMPRNHSVSPIMVMERGSTRGTQTAASSSRTGTSGAGEPRPHSERFWSLLRLVVFLLAALGLGAWGYLLRPTAVSPPSVSEPTITILANQQDVTAVVDMTLSADLGNTPPYSLALTITAVSPSQGIKFTVSFARLPAPAAGTGRGLHTSDNVYYTQINSAPGLSGRRCRASPLRTRHCGQSARTARGRSYVSPSRISSARSRALSPPRWPAASGGQPGQHLQDNMHAAGKSAPVGAIPRGRHDDILVR